MKHLSQTQFFMAALVLVLVITLVAVLADGLKKYDSQATSAEQEMTESMNAVPPSTPDAIIEELKVEEGNASAALEAELAYEVRTLEEEDADVTTITQSYE